MADELTAENLFKEFKEVQLSEFFRKNRQYLGYVGKIKSLTTVIHELVSNSLDACEESGILPDIKVVIKELGPEHYKIRVEDNGPGIPSKHLEHVFGKLLAGTKFHRNIQLRGQQGLGVSGAVLFSQITTGQPTLVKSGTGNGKVMSAKVELDIKTNSPKITDQVEESDSWRGTVVESEFKTVQYSKGLKGPFEYLRWTAAANPHTRIKFKDPEKKEIVFERVIDKIPKRPQEQKPHPEGLEVHDMLDLAHKSKGRQIATFLTTDLSRISADKVKEIQALCTFDLQRSPSRLEWSEAEQLIQAFKKVKFMAPPTAGLIPIGERYVEKALKNLVAPDFVQAITRTPTTYKGGIPFLVEVAIAFGGNAGKEAPEGKKMELMRFANRAPLLFDAGSCAITDAMNSIEWKRYKLGDVEHAPVTFFVNLISTHVPYTSAGKQAVAKEEEITNEIRFAAMQIARVLQKFLSGKRRSSEREERRKMFERYVPETAKAIAKLTDGKPEDLEKKLHQIVLDKYNDLNDTLPEEDEGAAYEEPEPEDESEEE